MIPGVHIYIDGVIKEGDKIVKKVRRQKGHSFVKQFAQMLLQQMGPVAITIKDTSNVNQSTFASYYDAVNAAANEATHGLLVGTSNTGVSISDYKIGTLIAHGINAGQLQYSACVLGAPTWDATSNYFIITRVWTNGSGGNITINEVALCVSSYYGKFCYARDVLVSPVTLTNGQNLTINYTIKATL